MSTTWRPDDSFLDKEQGELKGVRRVMDALEKHGVRPRGGVLTSQDRGVEATRDDLRRTHMPAGFRQFQLPVVLGPDKNVLGFMTEGEPNSEIPEHSHGVELFRVVISGSVLYGDQELKAGDWMSVEAGSPYGFKSGDEGCIIFHMYW